MTVEQLNVIITAQNTDFNNKINAVNAQLKSMQATAKTSASGALSSFKSLASGIVAIGIGKLIASSITEGMTVIENENLFEVSMGKFSAQAREWSENLGNALGLNARTLRKDVGVIFNMTKQMGIAGDSAYGLSTNLVQLANDMASFYNITLEEAFVKLRAGIVGETEPLRQLGIIVDENTVKQYAYKTGIAAVGTELSTQQKVLARYQAILAQTGTAQGDLARTLDSPANKLRRLQTDFEVFKQDLGAALMPLVSSIIPLLSEGLKTITPVITTILQPLSNLGELINNMNPQAKMFLNIAVLSAVAIPAVTGAIKLLTLAKTGLSSILTILIPKTITFGNILKSMFGWVSVIASVLSIFGMFNSKKEETAPPDYTNTADTANVAAGEVDGLSESVDGLKKSAGGLSGLDEINKIGSSNKGLSSLGIPDEALAGLDDLNQKYGEFQDISKANADSFSDFWGGVWEKLKSGDWAGALGEVYISFTKILGQIFGEDNIKKFNDFWGGIGAKMANKDWEGIFEDVCNGIRDLATQLSIWLEEWLGALGKEWVDGWGSLGDVCWEIYDYTLHPEKFQEDRFREMHGDEMRSYEMLQSDFYNRINDLTGGLANYRGLNLGELIGQSYIDTFYDGTLLKSFKNPFDDDKFLQQYSTALGISVDELKGYIDVAVVGSKIMTKSKIDDFQFTTAPNNIYDLMRNTLPYDVTPSTGTLLNGNKIGGQSIIERAIAEIQNRPIIVETHTSFEIDGDVIGEKVEEYQANQIRRTNGK